MSESRNPDDQSAPEAPASAAGESATPGGYEYSVAGDEPGGTSAPDGDGVRSPVLLVAAAIVGAALLGAAIAWIAITVLDDGGEGQAEAHVANVISAFSQGQGGSVSRSFQGALPPGWPDDIPSYPGARVISSFSEVQGGDVSYLAIWGTGDSRSDVADHFSSVLSDDPWQIDAGRDSRDSTLYTFNRIDNPDVVGLVMMAESRDDAVTTIIVSVQLVGGAADVEGEAYSPGRSRPLPEGFTDDFPVYPGATVIEALFERQPAGSGYAISFVTSDAPGDVLDFYEEQLDAAGWTIEDGEPGAPPGSMSFTGAGGIEGQLRAYEFPEDAEFTRVDVQLQEQRSGG